MQVLLNLFTRLRTSDLDKIGMSATGTSFSLAFSSSSQALKAVFQMLIQPGNGMNLKQALVVGPTDIYPSSSTSSELTNQTWPVAEPDSMGLSCTPGIVWVSASLSCPP